MNFVAMKTADQLDLESLHRVRERLVEGGPTRAHFASSYRNWDDQNRRNEKRERISGWNYR
jgi:hypothetical protein